MVEELIEYMKKYMKRDTSSHYFDRMGVFINQEIARREEEDEENASGIYNRSSSVGNLYL